MENNFNPCFGIVSYFPYEPIQQKQRQARLDRLIKQLSDLWPEVPILIIAQNWETYTLKDKCQNEVIIFNYPKLGIMGARKKLREHFLNSEFNYLIMFDDDAIIQCDNKQLAKEYLSCCAAHPNGFTFPQYEASQLNLCAISKHIYTVEPLPNIDPQNGDGFEDKIWAYLLHYKYNDLEFSCPAGLKCIHFKNPNINQFGGEVPSTWARDKQYNWQKMRADTDLIIDYIKKYKELPPWIKK